MEQREKDGSKTTNRQPRKKPKRGGTAKASQAPDTADAFLQKDVDRLTRELADVREQQAAATDILKVISRSTDDVHPVFNTIAESSVRLCGAEVSTVFRFDGKLVRLEAIYGSNAESIAAVRRAFPMPPGKGSAAARAVQELAVVQIPDIQLDKDYQIQDSALAAGFRGILAVPMLHQGDPIGAITVGRGEPGVFHDTQIQLLRTFAEQAVIAVENVRLFNELGSRNSELEEALGFQRATNDVLGVIGRSPGDVQPVFDAIVERAARLCESEFSTVARLEGDTLHLAAVINLTDKELAAYKTIFPRPVDRSFAMGRAILQKSPEHIEDVNADSDYDSKTLKILQDAGMYRTMLAIPMLRHGEPVGAIAVANRKVKPFSERQISLVQTFADQAVISIENVRQFEEIREKSRVVKAQAAELADLNQTLESRVQEQVEEIGRMSKLTRFLSPKISNLIMSGEVDDPLKTRRSEITAVYVDLRGFTSFTETADPEEVMTVLREYHSELGRAITEHDATIEHYAGDGAMILLNAPLPTENHAFQAIKMCLQMRETIGGLTDAWRKRGFELGCGAGIAGGYATLGMIGFEGRMDYSAVGTVCNLAARLSDEAEDRQILIPSRVLLQVEDLIEVEPLGERTFKGIQRSIEVYNVIGLRPSKDT